MKSSLSMAVLSSVLLSATMTAPVLAATHKPAKMTCEEFVSLDDAVKPKVVYWTEGFNHKGKPVDAVVDIDATDKLVPVLVTECQKTPKASFWQKIKKHF
ncbi:MAG: HdeA/HdeB family chaperone [Sulfuricella sp.]